MLICSHIVYGCFLTMSEPSSYKGNYMAGEMKYLLFGRLQKKFVGFCSREKLWIRDTNGKFGQIPSIASWPGHLWEKALLYTGACGHMLSDFLCQGRCTQLMFNKCLLFAVLIDVAGKHGVVNGYGDIPILPFPGFAWLWDLSWVDNFLFPPLVCIEKQLYYLNSPRWRM